MTSVEQLIGDLLLRHNCVIIPSFGGFVAKPVAAQIDYTKGTMVPPKKSLLFNRQLINNDGLLINGLSQRNKLSFDAASVVINETVHQWNTSLKKGGRIEIDRVGNLFFDDERNLCFEQDRFFNLLLESFGLGSVHFIIEEDVQIVEQQITIETNHEVAPTVEVEEHKAPIIELEPTSITHVSESSTTETTPRHIEQAMPRKRRPWRYVAAACILPIAFYSIWIPVNTDVLESGMISMHDFNPFHRSSEALYVKKTFQPDFTPEAKRESLKDEIESLNGENAFYSYEFTKDTYLNVRVADENKVALEKETPEETSSISTQERSFSIEESNYIVGCFGKKSNADKLVLKLNESGFDAHVHDIKNGLHRVTAGTAMSRESYQEIKTKADRLGYKGWKLK